MAKHFLFLFLYACSISALVHAQDPSGFISIDCGSSANTSYIDSTTGLLYVSDAAYIDTGVSKSIADKYDTYSLEKQFSYVRSFPEGLKNCYTLKPPQVNRTQYLIRARFMYANYDAKNKVPKFDIHLGVNYWATVDLFDDASTVRDLEILHVPSSSNDLHVCLVNTGSGIPFISVLELRLMRDDIYRTTKTGSMVLWRRLDMRTYSVDDRDSIRFKDDIYDRIWEAPIPITDGLEISTPLAIPDEHQNIFKVPSSIMRTAITPANASGPFNISWDSIDESIQYYVYFHFADVQSNQSREFDITLNGEKWYDKSVQPGYLDSFTVFSRGPMTGRWFNFSLVKTFNSTLPPIINALEIYTLNNISNPETDQGDVDAIKDIKSTYGVKRNWQGDPCTPQNYSWEDLNCSYGGIYDPPRITSLDLSFSGLTGKIAPSIFNLKLLRYLDLSNNSLTGDIPDFLSQMQKLTVLNLTGNNLTGTIPTELMERSKKGSLSLQLEGNPNLCTSNACQIAQAKKKKKNSMVVPIVAAIAAVAILLIAGAIFWMCFLKKKKPQQQKQQVASVVKYMSMSATSTPQNNRDASHLKSKNQQFTYAEVVKITKNFQTVIGKGGFGTVYHGFIDDTQVAVKMLSQSSAQGYKEFQAEAELLTRVHHRNLTILVGYCDEGDNLGLIYEYMANGNLYGHLSDKNPNVLSWETRLQIALDSALGLEYLHSGCKPPIVHRDIKSTNILLNEKFQAKLADLGLSRAFQNEAGGTLMSTAVAGTPGYLDPEYYVSYKLNEKSDVYSFGVVLLEMITGRPAIARTQQNTHISQWVSHILKSEGDVRHAVDPALREGIDINSVWKAVEVAMECVLPTSIQRPNMTHVVSELKQCLAMEKAQANQDMYPNEPMDSVELVSLNINTGMSPLARGRLARGIGKEKESRMPGKELSWHPAFLSSVWIVQEYYSPGIPVSFSSVW